jgi:hypothetical protein
MHELLPAFASPKQQRHSPHKPPPQELFEATATVLHAIRRFPARANDSGSEAGNGLEAFAKLRTRLPRQSVVMRGPRLNLCYEKIRVLAAVVGKGGQ